jgi:hypothetical protein
MEEYLDDLNEAYAIVRASGIPESLWPAAFAHVLATRGTVEPAHRDEASGPTTLQDEGDWLGRLAKRLRLEQDTLVDVFDLEDGEPRLIVPPSRLPRQRARAMRVVALLVASARQGAGIDDGWTATAVLRDACKEMGVFDQANFAAEITAVEGLAFKGSGVSRHVKVTARGFEQAAAEIEQLSR